MKFTYETQGAITYSVCELEPAEQIDSLTLGMLTNNHIVGFAPVLYTEMDGQRFLKYNISAKVSADRFFTGTMNRQRALTAFRSILGAICSADDYMIDRNCISTDAEHIFLNVSSCEAALLCIPVVTDKNADTEAAALFKKLMFSTQFDDSEDNTYVTRLLAYINNTDAFTVYGLKELVENLLSEEARPAQTPHTQQPAAMPSVSRNMLVTPPVSSFYDTISIDDIGGNTPKKQESVSQPPVQGLPTQPPVQGLPTQPPFAPPAAPARKKEMPQTMPTGARPISGGAPMHSGRTAGENNRQQKGSAMQKPIYDSRPDFAIPGQPAAGMPRAAAPTAAPQSRPAADESGEEKKISFFGLLSHYNKENAELYKKQKETAKAKKTADKESRKKKEPKGAAPQTDARQSSGSGLSSLYPMQQQVQPQLRQQIQPQIQPQAVPVQNSFNETTVLSPNMTSGETTVLGANPMMPSPCLIRVKTGERISINKPVFRIGKEKSYVDYFIADNTAISRSHANIHTENGEYFIEDTNSTNHTYINGELINSNMKTKLNSGDKIRLANEDFTFTV